MVVHVRGMALIWKHGYAGSGTELHVPMYAYMGCCRRRGVGRSG